MDKEKLQDAINAMQDGEKPGLFNDELATLLALVNKSSEADIAAMWENVSNE